MANINITNKTNTLLRSLILFFRYHLESWLRHVCFSFLWG